MRAASQLKGKDTNGLERRLSSCNTWLAQVSYGRAGGQSHLKEVLEGCVGCAWGNEFPASRCINGCCGESTVLSKLMSMLVAGPWSLFSFPFDSFGHLHNYQLGERWHVFILLLLLIQALRRCPEIQKCPPKHVSQRRETENRKADSVWL